MTGHLASHGRGGAGNIMDSSKSPKLQARDLETPVLRTSVVTTGRGGTGNMAKNTDPAETRARQDVDPVVRRPSHGAAHAGRGGAGNIFKPGSKEAEAAAAATTNGSAAVDDNASSTTADSLKKDSRQGSPATGTARPHHEHEKSLAAKGKEWLLGKK